MSSNSIQKIMEKGYFEYFRCPDDKEGKFCEKDKPQGHNLTASKFIDKYQSIVHFY